MTLASHLQQGEKRKMNGNQVIIVYDRLSYDKSKIMQIVKELNDETDVKIKELHHKGLEEYPTLYLVLIGIPLYWFSKSFFSRLGEKCADLLFKSKSTKTPNIGINFISQDNRKINIFFKPQNQKYIEDNINDKKIKIVYDEMEEYLKKDKNIVDFTVTLDNNGEIEEIYYFDHKNDVYSGKKPHKK